MKFLNSKKVVLAALAGLGAISTASTAQAGTCNCTCNADVTPDGTTFTGTGWNHWACYQQETVHCGYDWVGPIPVSVKWDCEYTS